MLPPGSSIVMSQNATQNSNSGQSKTIPLQADFMKNNEGRNSKAKLKPAKPPTNSRGKSVPQERPSNSQDNSI
jgi:hypothetical protein